MVFLGGKKWDAMTVQQLLGREQVALDAKHRLAMPARYRESVQLLCADALVLTEHPDGFLLLMPQPKWGSFSQQFAQAGGTSQWLKRIILGGACPVVLDSAKRFLLPQVLRQAAGIDKQVLLVGVGEYFEIWNPADFATQRDKQRAQRQTDVAAQECDLQTSLQEVRW
jgi:MraZ protein